MDGLGDILASTLTPGPSPYAQPGAAPTQLGPLDEMAFRQWVAQNQVPFDPNRSGQDYDMRGFYQGVQQQQPRATSAINPNDQRMHYPDYWKMPTHQTFSQDSKWALPVAPRWNELDQLVSPGGRILFDERR
jgi:hypothetical protein